MAPDEGVAMGVPVAGGLLDGLADLGPGLEAAAFEGERPEHLPPGLTEPKMAHVLSLVLQRVTIPEQMPVACV